MQDIGQTGGQTNATFLPSAVDDACAANHGQGCDVTQSAALCAPLICHPNTRISARVYTVYPLQIEAKWFEIQCFGDI